MKDNNLFLTHFVSQQDYQLTKDGECYYNYATSPETNTCTITEYLEGIVPTPIAIWSSDSQKIVTHKLDQRNVKSLSLLKNAPEQFQRPELFNYRMSFSGDSDLPLAELLVIDVVDKTVLPLKIEPFLSPYLTPLEFKWVWWSDKSQKIYFLRDSRGSKELHLCVADANTGLVDVLISETATTYVEPSQLFPWPPQIIILEDRQEIVWLSERNGYSHLYLFALHGNILKNTITHGEWCVREIHFYDAKLNWLYFTACGYHKDLDPYYKQLFRCRLDGTQIECLTSENAHHSVYISSCKKYFLDTHSTINTVPISTLKNMHGKTICHIETADINGLIKMNWVPPKRLCLKARDGVTLIYGNLYFPSHFDATKKYPIIDHIYPGPQFYRTPTHFNLFGAIFRSGWTAQALAELGFIVIHVDGLGTPGRSKAFHDATYQDMGDCGIPDHVCVIKQLAAQFTFIDLERVGITGYSGGGYAAVRAMLKYPEFFKVAVAAGGNHDLRCYPANYGEKYNSLDSSTYANQSNTTLAERLCGKLLLVHGEMDDNVHPCATYQLIDALIKHNKDFDMLIMPNQNHSSTFDHPYYMRRHWDYFVKHLLGEIAPINYYIKPMPVEFPQLIDW
jgi:dipeptidyl-peptidase-4